MQLDLTFNSPPPDYSQDLSEILKQCTAEQRKYLFGPIVHQSHGWSSCVPEWLIKSVPQVRLELILSQLATGEPQALAATDEEAAILLFGAALDGPLSQDYSEMYFHIVSLIMKKHKGLVVEAGKGAFTGYHESLLLSLKTKIRASAVRNSIYGKKKKNDG
jgi:hypothetical protein